ncbi:MAG TPA: DUF4249 domain-containing protein [Cyclobacteriaceae bacterium]|nr:DUF4249 domain-containing protein [Cyclobacteriaceae bacterium]
MIRYVSWLIIIVVSGCIDPINLRTGTGGSLVVDGWITDQPGPYTIKLSRTVAYDNSQPVKVFSAPETKATLTVVDNVGNIEVFTETTTKGTYRNALTSTFKPKVGSAYQLIIKTAGGKSYHSAFDTMMVVPPIARLMTKFKVVESLITNAAGNSVIQKRESFDVSVEVNDPVGIRNYYRWQSDGIFEYFSVTDFSALKQCWAPYLTKIEPVLEIESDDAFDGQKYQKIIGNIIYDRTTKFLVKVRQQSLTAAAYKYFRGISIQGTSTGTLFDPPPADVRGNVVSDADPQETVLGFFGCSSVSLGNYLIDRFKDSGFINPSQNILPVPGDCRTQQPGATNIKPDGF